MKITWPLWQSLWWGPHRPRLVLRQHAGLCRQFLRRALRRKR